MTAGEILVKINELIRDGKITEQTEVIAQSIEYKHNIEDLGNYLFYDHGIEADEEILVDKLVIKLL